MIFEIAQQRFQFLLQFPNFLLLLPLALGRQSRPFAFQLCLALRGTIHLNRRFDPAQALATVNRHGCTSLFASALITGGVGPWLPYEMFGCAWIGMIAGLLRAVRRRWELVLLAGYGAAPGYGYGCGATAGRDGRAANRRRPSRRGGRYSARAGAIFKGL